MFQKLSQHHIKKTLYLLVFLFTFSLYYVQRTRVLGCPTKNYAISQSVVKFTSNVISPSRSPSMYKLINWIHFRVNFFGLQSDRFRSLTLSMTRPGLANQQAYSSGTVIEGFFIHNFLHKD